MGKKINLKTYIGYLDWKLLGKICFKRLFWWSRKLWVWRLFFTDFHGNVPYCGWKPKLKRIGG